ncbi:ATP-dependent DNA helicase [Histoplasma capsulatum G186AR]|uniref:DNA 3'-5' helicase n=1 Tax=Ajellomyces capsulatus (strain G186AR / H82 / ATCC MYA-2454 / RMSCC 2432) TaxID=447093 RepID=C0NPT8_AJECG|nr:ATP-dependent DNA helicase [Histoplasma capsulatum G186AR]EEH06948.1 ATP-dependent DNA helicase [Histoplasma capsulatum G186AR]
MPQVVMSYAEPESIDKQQDVIEHCLRRILQGPRPDPKCTLRPHIEQVRMLRRMIYGYGDTLFIARTGYGKSLILQSYTILTGKITIQLIPLNKLGDQQTDDIAQFPSTNPCLISASNLQGEEHLLKRIQQCEYTHILLSPEQALSKQFQCILQDPTLQEKIGLVAIDECHLITQWSGFRGQFARLGHLRLLLREDIVWFGCSATLSSKDEDIILQNAGFRSVGDNPRQTQIIRTSINRPDIFIGIHPIPRGKLASYDMLYFLLNEAVDTDGKIIPQSILKTIVFIDSIVKVHQAVQFFRSMLLQLCQNNSQNTDDIDTSFINDTIQLFHSRVSEVDKNNRFKEFMEPTSKIRIMVATTSLGMGINIPDVERTVVWGFPIEGGDIADVWQRCGRGGRRPGRKSHALIFLPYWAFDSEGYEKKALQHSQPLASQLSQFMNFEDISDAESIASNMTSQSQSQCRTTTVKAWTESEMQRRANLSADWKTIINGPCHRKGLLTYLGEDRLPFGMDRMDTSMEECCSRCNSSRVPAFKQPPTTNTIKGPRVNSRSAILLSVLKNWCTQRAEEQCHHDRGFPVPASRFMSTQCQWQIAALFHKETPTFGSNWNELCDAANLLQTWSYQDEFDDQLHSFLLSQIAVVNNTYEAVRIARYQRQTVRNMEKAAEIAVSTEISGSDSVSEETAAQQLTAAWPTTIASASTTPQSTPPPSPRVCKSTTAQVHTPRKRRSNNKSIDIQTPRKRTPLGERNANAEIVFTKISRFGRVQTPSRRGRDNFSIENDSIK